MSKNTNESKKENRDLKSLDQLQDWSKWMVGIEALTLMYSSKSGINGSCLYPVILIFGSLTILAAAWVLSGIPSVTRRVNDDIELTDHLIYDMPKCWFIKGCNITLNYVAIAQHLFFAITVLLVGLSLYCAPATGVT